MVDLSSVRTQTVKIEGGTIFELELYRFVNHLGIQNVCNTLDILNLDDEKILRVSDIYADTGLSQLPDWYKWLVPPKTQKNIFLGTKPTKVYMRTLGIEDINVVIMQSFDNEKPSHSDTFIGGVNDRVINPPSNMFTGSYQTVTTPYYPYEYRNSYRVRKLIISSQTGRAYDRFGIKSYLSGSIISTCDKPILIDNICLEANSLMYVWSETDNDKIFMNEFLMDYDF